MLSLLKRFAKEEDGLGTVEIVIIIAVLVGIALIFKSVIVNFVTTILKNIFGQANDTKIDANAEAKSITG
jgi:Flp pilus assembly pilin Flp